METNTDLLLYIALSLVVILGLIFSTKFFVNYKGKGGAQVTMSSDQTVEKDSMEIEKVEESTIEVKVRRNTTSLIRDVKKSNIKIR